MKKTQLYLLSSGLFLLLLLVVFVVAELGLRYSVLRDATESRDHVRETDYMPVKLKNNYQGVFWGIPFSTNQYGFRDEEDFPKTPAADEFRILSLGDSIGFGLGIPASAHYTKVLERGLNGMGASRRFHVVNAAGQGYSPSNYYVYLQNEGLELAPNMVIADIEMCTVITNEALLHWVTDPATPETPAAVRGGRYVVGWDGNMLATFALGGYFFEKTYVYTDLLRRFLNLMYRASPTEPFRSQMTEGVSYYSLGFDKYVLNEQRLESGWHKTFGSLRAIHKLLDEKGISFRLMIIPSRYMFEEEAPAWRAYARRLMERGLRRVRELDIPHQDFTEPVANGGGKSLYYDFAHMTEEGNRVLGDALFEQLAEGLDSRF